jgi:2-hydroxy-3-oxopropionate reductase
MTDSETTNPPFLETMAMSKVGFIGLGIMGAPMAAHLIDGGHALFLYSRKPPRAELTAKGALACASAQEVAERSDIVIIMVPDTPDVGAVLFSETGVAAGLTKGKIVVDMSSISPIETKAYAARIEALGCDYLDAPVSGGEIGAKAASLTIMVGGKATVFENIVALTIEAIGEALLFASKAGANPAKVREALMGGFANSRILEVHGDRMLKRAFDPGFRIELHQKDLNLALSAARKMGMSLPNTATAQELFNACVAHGGARWDHSAMVRALEILAQHEIAGGAISSSGG